MVFRLLDYGAAADGVINDTAAIPAASDVCAAAPTVRICNYAD